MVKKYKIIPVAVFESVEEAREKLAALCEGGLPVAEICFRTDCAESAIRAAVKEFPQMAIGAGTVINAEQCTRAIDAGAKFVVSPGLSVEVAEVCRKRGVPYYAGAVTPTEIMQAVAMGLTTLKFFPASDFGGLKTIKALGAAFPQIEFMPTGGVSESNLAEYLACPRVAACGGSWMLKGGKEEIIEKTKRAVAIAKGV